MSLKHPFTIQDDHTVTCHVINPVTGKEDFWELRFQEEGSTYTFLLKKNGVGVASTRDLIEVIGENNYLDD